MKPRKVNKIVEEVTKNIIKRSKLNRLKYLQKLKDARFADATEGMPDEIDSDYPFIASRY